MATGNHYSKQVLQLESVLNGKLKQLTLLEEENKLLQHKETALRSAIEGIAGPLALVKEVLVEGGSFTSTGSGAAASAGRHHQNSKTHSPATSCGDGGPQWQTPSNSSDTNNTNSLAGVEGSGNSVTSHLSAAVSYKGGPALLERLDDREERVQRVLQQMGCCDGLGYKQLYTTQLLRKAVADPITMAGYLNMPKPERLKYWARAHTQMALLLSKYDCNVSLATGNVKDQLDHVVDELFERVTVCALLDPPARYMQCFMFNVETQEFEQYPQGWWTQVVKGMAMSTEQAAAIKLVWDKVKAGVQQLTQHYAGLQQQLQCVHAQQLHQNRQFEQDILRLPALQSTLIKAEQIHKQQKQQQQQHQQQILEEPPELQDLLTSWQQDDTVPGTEGNGLQHTETMEFQFIAELMAELEDEQPQPQPLNQPPMLQQQQQQQQAGSWSQSPVVVPNGAVVMPTAVQLQTPGAAMLAPAAAAAVAAQLPSGSCGYVDMPGAAGQTASVAALPHCTPAVPPVPLWDSPVSGSALLPQQMLGQRPAAAAMGNSNARLLGSPPSIQQQQPQQQEACVGDANSGTFAIAGGVAPSVTPGTHKSRLGEAEEVLLQAGSEERQQLEARMEACNAKIKVLNFCACSSPTRSRRSSSQPCVCTPTRLFSML